MKPHFAMLAGYNAWANRRVYAAAAALSDADYRADRGAFFKSVHGTLNHLLVADRIWMRRFTGGGNAPNRLDAILFESLAELRTAREQEDQRIEAYIAGLNDTALAASSATARSPIPWMSSSRWHRRCCISSTIRPITAGKRTRSSQG